MVKLHYLHVSFHSALQKRLPHSASFYGPFIAIAFAIISARFSNIHTDDASIVLVGWCTWIALLSPIAGIITSLFSGAALNFFHMAPRHSLVINKNEDFVLGILVASIGIVVSIATMYRINQALFRLNQRAAISAMDDFIERATRDQPTLAFAQHALEAFAGELIFIDVRLEKNKNTELPTYDVTVWNNLKNSDLPKTIDVPPGGIAVKFHSPKIWYEIVFSSRRGYGNVPVRRILLQGFVNRVETLLAFRLKLEERNNGR